jgi:hypothetical protein
MEESQNHLHVPNAASLTGCHHLGLFGGTALSSKIIRTRGAGYRGCPRGEKRRG